MPSPPGQRRQACGGNASSSGHKLALDCALDTGYTFGLRRSPSETASSVYPSACRPRPLFVSLLPILGSAPRCSQFYTAKPSVGARPKPWASRATMLLDGRGRLHPRAGRQSSTPPHSSQHPPTPPRCVTEASRIPMPRILSHRSRRPDFVPQTDGSLRRRTWVICLSWIFNPVAAGWLMARGFGPHRFATVAANRVEHVSPPLGPAGPARRLVGSTCRPPAPRAPRSYR